MGWYGCVFCSNDGKHASYGTIYKRTVATEYGPVHLGQCCRECVPAHIPTFEFSVRDFNASRHGGDYRTIRWFVDGAPVDWPTYKKAADRAQLQAAWNIEANATRINRNKRHASVSTPTAHRR